MHRLRWILVLIWVAVPGWALMAWAQTSTAPAKSPGPGSKLAVIDLRQLYESLDEKLDTDRELENARADYLKLMERQKAEIDRLSAEVERPTLYKKGSPEFLKMQDDLLQKSNDLQSNTQFYQQKLFILLHGKTLEIHRKMDEAIAAYARANDVAVVLVSSELDLATARTAQELEGMPTMRKLAYYHPAFDITRAVTERMNTDYKVGARKP